jgi:uncharacterized lipoprotein YajG
MTKSLLAIAIATFLLAGCIIVPGHYHHGVAIY